MDISILTPKFFELNCKHLTPTMNNEEYLIEVLNGSTFFSSKRHRFERYQLSKEQAHGEPDAVSSTYCIDFKLLIDQETMHAMSKNKPEVDYSKMNQGYILVKTKQNTTPVPSNNILLDLMRVTLEDIQRGALSDTVKNLINNLKIDKNLFFYYPYEFSSESDVPRTFFEKILNASLSTLMQYRTSEQPERETYVCIKASKLFLIYEWVINSFVFRDEVHEMLCCQYREAKMYSVY